MAARALHYLSLCRGCGHPKATAWHPDNDGWFSVTSAVTCWGCTAKADPDEQGKVRPVEYLVVEDVRDYSAKPLPPFPKAKTPTT